MRITQQVLNGKLPRIITLGLLPRPLWGRGVGGIHEILSNALYLRAHTYQKLNALEEECYKIYETF